MRCKGTGREPLKRLSIKKFVKACGNIDKMDEMLKLFTFVDHAGNREAISAMLRCPLMRKSLGHLVAWDRAWELGLLQVGPRNRKAPTRYEGSPRSAAHAWDSRFRLSLIYLSDEGTRYVATKLGRVRAQYGWRSTDSKARGVQDGLKNATKARNP